MSSEAEYFRTRHACMERLKDLVQACQGNALLAFDFPMGYPVGSSLGGGRVAGRLLADMLTRNPDDGNNRFDVAGRLNKQLSPLPGPFWGHPASSTYQDLSRTKPPFNHSWFREWRLVEAELKSRGHRIMNVWQLLGQGSVGSQTVTGLAELYSFAKNPALKDQVRFWPFETRWEQNLDGIILAELWPSLGQYEEISHPIKDARQVIASRNWLSRKQRDGEIKDLFSPPDCLTAEEQKMCETEEGWILGVTSRI